MTTASAWLERWRTARALGVGNVAKVVVYRGMKRAKVAKWITSPPMTDVVGDVFATDVTLEDASLGPDLAVYFSRHEKTLNGHVPWLYDPFADEDFEEPERHWSEIPDFVKPGRDIKAIWELSRFDWLIKLALQARDQGGDEPIAKMNALIHDWQRHNPPYFGPNWKCGQETTIRMLQTLLAGSLIDRDGMGARGEPSDALKAFVEIHAMRVAATLHYALAQNNNHSISEATGLFIAGGWLVHHDAATARAHAWLERGRHWLERLAIKLFAEDGSFSQYSITYHRFVIDMLAQAEWWRRRLDLPAFSDVFHTRVAAGTEWLFDLTDPMTGDGPNVGSNDGARLFVLTDTDYRDFRPSVQLASQLFEGRVPYPKGEHDQQLTRLGLKPEPRETKARTSRVMADGGFVLMIPRARDDVPSSWASVRFPSFAFRPAHADALHLDLWVDGVNLLRDGGSYSYNPAPGATPDLRATAAHNTIEFDGRDQMPRLGRFLFGDWLKSSHVGELIEEGGTLSWTGAYKDGQNCHHRRTITSDGRTWRVRDEIEGQIETATLRWRLAPGDWRLDRLTLQGPLARLSIETDAPPLRAALVDGKESRYYLELETIPVFEIDLGSSNRSIVTTIELLSAGER